MIGLKRGSVKLCDHEAQWEIEAQNTINHLKRILGNVIKDIQHVGSTSIPSIKAKPIIDIALAVDDFDEILSFTEELEADGFFYRPNSQPSVKNQLLFACGSFYTGAGDLQTHFIHVVRTNSMDWINYINFRDYLNDNPSIAKEYEDLKISLAALFSSENGRTDYLSGKHDFIVHTLRKALVKSYLGKKVDIKITMPIGSVLSGHPDIAYPINHGILPGVFNSLGKELGVYLIGVNIPVEKYTAQIVGIVHRCDDNEDKLVAVPEGLSYNYSEILEAIHFQEQYYKSKLELYNN